MADRPIIFGAPMIAALLAGRKTQTRRLLKPQPTEQPPARCHPAHTQVAPAPYLDAYCGEPKTPQNPRGMSRIWHWWQVDNRLGPPACKVSYIPGDRLWVRETWAQVGDAPDDIHACPDMRVPAYYSADVMAPEQLRWRSPIHMPRWASRITLTVTDVRVQRVQDISEADAIAEGVERLFTKHECNTVVGLIGSRSEDHGWTNYLWHGRHDAKPSHVDQWPYQYSSYGDARGSFSSLWAKTHGPDAWGRNDWVEAITFTVRHGNIDAMPEAAHA